MLPFAARFASRSPRRLPGVALTIGLALAPTLALASDFNADYKHGCTMDYGGIAFAIDGVFTPTNDFILSPFDKYRFKAKSCTTTPSFTLVSWACDVNNTSNLGPCIAQNQFVHVGFSSNLMTHTVNSAFVYKNSAQDCEYAANLDLDANCLATGYDESCMATPVQLQQLLADQVQYHPLATPAWYVHADGKSLTVINGPTFPSHPCPGPVYVGDVRFHYYSTRQRLSTLSADSLQEAIEVVSARDSALVACGDSATISVFSNPPEDAHFVVVTATQDTVPTLDSPGVSHVWIQEAIVREGEHAIGTNAGPNGAIAPSGPVVVANGTSLALTITPGAGYRVADVLVDGASVGAVTTYTFSNVTADHRIDATFVPINAPPDCGHVRAVPDRIWPPNHRLVTVKLAALSDPDGDPIAAKIVRVTQDEPSGSGPHRPDAVVDSTDTCQLLAERDGNGNGRVYTLWYSASDGRGGECGGSVQVCVPHDRHDLECIDDGPVDKGLRPRSKAAPGVRSPHAGRLELGRTSISGHQAIVEYAIPSAGMVQLGLFDVAGRRLMIIESSARTEGLHRTVWDTRGIASGIYFYRLRAGSEEVVKKLIIR